MHELVVMTYKETMLAAKVNGKSNFQNRTRIISLELP